MTDNSVLTADVTATGLAKPSDLQAINVFERAGQIYAIFSEDSIQNNGNYRIIDPKNTYTFQVNSDTLTTYRAESDVGSPTIIFFATTPSDYQIAVYDEELG